MLDQKSPLNFLIGEPSIYFVKMGDDFPCTLFAVDLPDDYKLSQLAEIFEQFGPVIEMEMMQDGHVRTRFQKSTQAKACFVKAKKGKLELNGKKIRLIPKSKK